MQCFKTNILMLLMIYFEKFLFDLTNDFLANFFLKYISARFKKNLIFYDILYSRRICPAHNLSFNCEKNRYCSGQPPTHILMDNPFQCIYLPKGNYVCNSFQTRVDKIPNSQFRKFSLNFRFCKFTLF